jgi:AraC-like DNA-binding protein
MLKSQTEHSVYPSPINAVLQAAESLGANRAELLAGIDLEAQQLQESDNRFPVSKLYQLLALAESNSNNADVALYAGRVAYLDGLNLQLYMSTICTTFREYLNMMPSVLKLSGDTGEIEIHADGEQLRMEWVPLLPETSQQRYLTDLFLTTATMIVSSLCIKPIPILKAHFSYSEPSDCTVLHATFGLNLVFDQPVSCIYYQRESLNYPITHLDYKLTKELTEPLSHLFDELSPPDEFLAALHQSIVKLLPLGDMTIDGVAQELNVSRRSLQRRLTDRETTFIQVLQDIRANLALRYLDDKKLSITQIAFLLGYSDQGSFSTAFKSWHGQSPSQFR